VGKIADGLVDFLQSLVLELIQKDGEQDGRPKGKEQVEQAQKEGVLEGAEKEYILEESPEVLEPDPGTFVEAQYDVVILEGYGQAVDGQIAENKEAHDCRHEHDVEVMVDLQIEREGPYTGYLFFHPKLGHTASAPSD
jgi:hypothetical protein